MSEEFGPDFISVTDEEGNEFELELVDSLEHNGVTYYAMFPAVEEDEKTGEPVDVDADDEEYGLVIMKVVEENGEVALRFAGHRIVLNEDRAAAVFRELVSPASDYFAMLILFFVAITWAQLLEKKEASPVPYALLSLYLVYAATVKLSAAGMLLLALYPAFLLLRQRKWGQIACYLGLGTVIAFPWLARNVLISGWLFYPFTFLDLFDADWKISKGYADSDAAEIQVYAKEIFDVYQKDMPFGQWFPNWLRAQSVLDRLLVAAGWLAVPVSILTMAAGAGRRVVIWAAGKHGTGTLRKEGGAYRGFVLLEAAALFGFLIWQFGAPLVRYGYFFVLFLPLTAFGGLYVRFFGKGRGFRLFAAFLVAFLLYRGYNLGNMVLELWQEPYYVYQQDYGTWPAETYQVDGVTVYVPLDRGQIGYDKFPSSPVVQSIELRDKKTIESGFRQKAAGTPAGEE